MNILYLSYDGLLDPLGYSQVFQYLKGLATSHQVSLISYEKEENWADVGRVGALKGELSAASIQWHPLRYHKRPTVFATSFDILAGFLAACFLVRRKKIAIVHARSYVASVIALALKIVFDVRFIFDMRGLWADEKVDNGDWVKSGRLYRIAKWFERRFLLAADRVVSLTRSGVDEMRGFDYLQGRMPKFEVITTCTNLEHFRRQGDVRTSEFDRGTAFTMGHVGSATYSYLFDDALRCYKLLLEVMPGAQLLVLNRGHHDLVRKKLEQHAIGTKHVELRAVDYLELPREMSRMDASIFFIRRTYSKVAMAPTKLGELLGCGVPCLSNTGVGDMASILEGEGVGVTIEDFNSDSLAGGIRTLVALTQDPGIRARCRRTAERYFGLEGGIEAYRRIYLELGSGHGVRERQGA